MHALCLMACSSEVWLNGRYLGGSAYLAPRKDDIEDCNDSVGSFSVHERVKRTRGAAEIGLADKRGVPCCGQATNYLEWKSRDG